MKNLSNIDFLIFDLGNVIINIDYDFTINELKKTLPNEKHELTEAFFPSSFHKNYEKGLISSPGFRNEVRAFFQEDWSDEFIDYIWNSLLKDIPQERIDLIRNLRKDFGTAVLSNTNEIHIIKFDEILQAETNANTLTELTDKTFLSHEMGLAKPDQAIYAQVLEEIGIPAEKVLFFDDLASNLEGAQSLGIQTHQITHPKGLMDFFAHVY